MRVGGSNKKKNFTELPTRLFVVDYLFFLSGHTLKKSLSLGLLLNHIYGLVELAVLHYLNYVETLTTSHCHVDSLTSASVE